MRARRRDREHVSGNGNGKVDAGGGKDTGRASGGGSKGSGGGGKGSGGGGGGGGGNRNRGNRNRKRNRNRNRGGGGSGGGGGGGPRGGQATQGAGFWGEKDRLPDPTADVRITDDPAAVARSLGAPPLPGHEKIAEHYFTVVYERAVQTAGALAAAGGLIDPETLTAELGD